MRKLLLFLISFFIGIILFVWVLNFVSWEEIKNALLVFTGWQGLLIFFLTFLLIFIATLKWREVLKGCGGNIAFFTLLKFYLASFFLSFFFPAVFLGGEIFRGYLLKKRNSISWSKGMASIIIDRIFDWTANLIIIFLGITAFILTIAFPPRELGIILGFIFFLWAVGVSFFYFKVFKKESLIRFFLKFLNYKKSDKQPLEVEREIFNFFELRKKIIYKRISLAFLTEVISILRTWLLIVFLGKNIGFLPALSITSFSYLAAMIPIPAALGIHEAAQIFAFNSLNLEAALAPAFTMIIRGAELILALLGIIILFQLGFVLLQNNLFQKIENLNQDNKS